MGFKKIVAGSSPLLLVGNVHTIKHLIHTVATNGIDYSTKKRNSFGMHNYVIIRHIWQFLRSVGQSTSSYTDVPSFSSTCSSFEAEREKRFIMVMYTVWLFIDPL